MTEYEALLHRLVAARRFGVDLGLDRMAALIDRLGNPERHLGTIVHVGGTNGKGSTVAMIATMLRETGRSVATYTSPHLTSLRERVAFPESIGEAEFVAAAREVSAAGGDALTFFEQITAIGFLAIARRDVDASVIEVGLGGRLDATNVVAARVAVVTGVALDHEAILGPTLAAIAAEKAGIWKPGQDAVVGASGEAEAQADLVRRARAVAARVIVVDDARIAAVPALALVGAHQRANAAAAIAVMELLDLPVAGLDQVVHPGRFERVADAILDGAHNPHGAAALAEALRGSRATLVLGVSADKDVARIVGALAPVCARVIATRYQQERALPPAELAAHVAAAGIPVEVAPDLAAALGLARGHAERPIVVAGSLFLVGEARTLLCDAPTDPIRVSDPAAKR